MRSGVATTFLLILFLLLESSPAIAQKQLVSSVDFDNALVYYRPRIALSARGEYAVSWEMLKKLENGEEWQIALQRFSAQGERLDADMRLLADQYCIPFEGKDASQQEYIEHGLRNVEMDFSAEGMLSLSMEQFQVFRDAGSQDPRQLTGFRMSMFDAQGQEMLPAQKRSCEWALVDPLEEAIHGAYTAGGDGNVFLALVSGEPNYRTVPSMNASLDSWGADEYTVRPVSNMEPQLASDIPGQAVPLVTTFEEWGENEVRKITIRQSGELPALMAQNSVPPGSVASKSIAGNLIARNSTGQGIAVWVDFSRNEEGRILAQQYNAAGEPTGQTFEIYTAHDFVDAEEGSRPEVAILNSGRFLVVWTSHGEDGMRAWGRYFDAAGVAEGEAFLLDPGADVESGFPDVTSNGSQFAYTWLVDQDGVTSIFANLPGITNTIDQALPEASASLAFKGYPNPFVDQTTLAYVLKESGHVTLIVYDLLGREVKKVVDQEQAPGAYSVELDGADFAAAGYYVARLKQGSLSQTQLLVRTE